MFFYLKKFLLYENCFQICYFCVFQTAKIDLITDKLINKCKIYFKIEFSKISKPNLTFDTRAT